MDIKALFDKLPFRSLAEKIPSGTRAKVPLLDKAIPFANYIANGLLVVLVVVVIAAASGSGNGGSGKSKSAGGSGKQSPFLSLAEKYYGADLKFWENKATETDAAKAPGFIARGKFNLKVTGPMNTEDLKNLIGAIKNLKGENASQLVRLDLSATTGLQMAESGYGEGGAFDGVNLGSIVLPDGLGNICDFAFRGCPLFEINPIPSSVKEIKDQAFGSTYLTRIVYPANFSSGSRVFAYFSSSLPSTAVFSEGHEVADLEGFGNTLLFGSSPIPPMTIIFPSTLKEIKCGYGDDLYRGIDTMYFYGETPPKPNTSKDMFFKNIKTIYVPSGAVKAYEDAYFSIGNIDVKALSGNRANFSYWLQPVPCDKNAILKEYKAAAAEGKKKAQERDKKFQEDMKKEFDRIFK
jgi:hypothetical protein